MTARTVAEVLVSGLVASDWVCGDCGREPGDPLDECDRCDRFLRSTADHLTDALTAAGVAVEGEVRVEWDVRWPDGHTATCDSQVDALLRRAGHARARILRRTVTAGEWVDVDE